MVFVNWLRDVCDPLRDPDVLPENHLPSGVLLWVHPVTRTCYYLEREKADEITRAGFNLAETLMKDNDAATAAEYLSCFFAQPDVFSRKLWLEKEGLCPTNPGNIRDSARGYIPLVALWPELPYPGQSVPRAGKKNLPAGWLRGENKPCVRLADFLLLRTGLFHALAADRMQPEEWPSLRLTSLLDGSGIFGVREDPTGLVPIPEELRGAYETASFLAGYPDVDRVGDASGTVEVVEGGVFKVKDYYLETNRIGEIRGASVLLDDINRKRYIQMFRKLPGLTAESIVYAGGGHLMAVVPVGKGEMVAGEIERLHREVCLTARAVGVACEAKASELADFRRLRRRLDEEIVARRSVLVPAWDAAEGAIDLYCEGFSEGESLSLPTAEPGKSCASCGIRPAVRVWPYEDERRPLCASCLRKQRVGHIAKKTVFAGEYRCFWQARGEHADLPAAREVEEIADANNEIAVVYADGNNFGPLFSRCESLAELRLLSQFTENAAYTAAFTALKEIIANRAVEIIALGGDDIFMLVPARAALPLAVTIGEHFGRLFRNLTSSTPNPTLSLGVAIAGAKTPVRYLFELAQALLKEAKKRVYKAKEALEEGTLDVAVLASYATYEDNIAAYRKATLCKNDAKLTLRPYTFSEARRLMDAVCRLQAAPQAPGRSWFYGLRQAVEQYGRQVAELFFNYQYARLSDAQRETLGKCWESLTGQSDTPGMFCARDGSCCCPWLDVVELWNYVGVGGETC